MERDAVVRTLGDLSRLYLRVDNTDGAVSAVAASDAQFDAWARTLARLPRGGCAHRAWPLEHRLAFVCAMQGCGVHFVLVEIETADADPRVRAALLTPPTAPVPEPVVTLRAERTAEGAPRRVPVRRKSKKREAAKGWQRARIG